MKLNKLLKSLAIALPIVTLAACSSNQSTDTGASSQTTNEQTQPDNSGVETAPAERVLSPAEQREQRMAELRQENMVFFEFDDSRITSEFAELLAAHADYLVKNPSVNVVVEGHCDERGTPEYNIALGERRAKAVAEYLRNLGVSASQISTVSYGEEKPMVRSSTADAYAKNRRGVLVY